MTKVHPLQSHQSQEPLLRELCQLAATIACRSDLHVVLGDPGCGWSFNWSRGRITVDPEDLQALAPDLCRGLILHEASHAAVTVLHQVLSRQQLQQLMPLLNTIEDMRIESWMRRRVPGAASWIRAYNDAIYGQLRDAPLPESRREQFLRGILEQWWWGSVSNGMRPEVELALLNCQTAITDAVACQPPLQPDRASILASQQALWGIVETRLLPTWNRLARLDAEDGLQGPSQGERNGSCQNVQRTLRPASQEHLKCLCEEPGASISISSSPGRPVPINQTGRHRPPAADLDCQGLGDYHAAWRLVSSVADRLGDELLRVLVPARRTRWSAGHAYGPRLDLRRAMRFDTDPRPDHSVWSRPSLPNHHEAAVCLLVDRSGSMKNGKRMPSALAGVALLAEVCHRIGVPLTVWSFADDHRCELRWHEPLNDITRRQLGRLRRSCGGSTRMTPALDAVAAAFDSVQARPQLLCVLTDGNPDEPATTTKMVQTLSAKGISTFGLGLGHRSRRLHELFPESITGIAPADIPLHLGRLLQRFAAPTTALH